MCLTDIVATADGPPEYVEFKVPGGDYEGDVSAYIGALVQNDGLDLTMNHAPLFSVLSWIDAYFIYLADGSLWGSGSDSQGYESVRVGDRVGVLVKAGAKGYVRFYRNIVTSPRSVRISSPQTVPRCL